jgi:hypothetical protein
MRKVYSTDDLMQCGMLKSVLDANGIQSLLKNEAISGVFGGSSYNPHLAYPELWVDDSDFEKAKELIYDNLESRPPRE